MAELVRDWLMGVTCAAMAVALAESLMPQGTVKKIGRLTGGLLLLLAMLQPLLRWQGIDLGELMAGYEVEVQGYSTALEEENQNLMKELIAEEAGAYIVDKAAEAGFSCTAAVEVRTGEGGVPIPWSAEIRGTYTEGQRRALSGQIAADLAIPEERQSYQWEEVE